MCRPVPLWGSEFVVLSSRDLDRIADDIYLNRRITGSVYCSNCAYNLRTLPYAYTCPECGQAYNARPRSMKGVFCPREYHPPYGKAAACLFFGAPAFFVLRGVYIAYGTERLILGLALVFFTILYMFQVVRGFRRYMHERMIARQIMEDEAT